MYFEYGQEEIEYLSQRDKMLKFAIETIGMIDRPLDEDLFSSVVYHIIGQQISVSAQATVRNRLIEKVKVISVETISNISIDDLQKCGMTFRKAEYIKLFSQSVVNKELILEELELYSDEEVIRKLSSIKGIGIWTAEMIMTFAMQRPNIISYGDLAILRGMRMLYRHRKITPALFAKYANRYTPYGTTAAIYFWAIAAGAIPTLSDPMPKKKRKNNCIQKKK